MREIKIDISTEINRFENHLNLIDNNQIIFSGIFGIGKTYFINKFFEEKNDSYELIYLSPVNYSVSQNEDVFEYIKYDVLYELLKKNIDFDNTNFSDLLTSPIFIKNNLLEIFSLIIENTSKIGKEITDIISSLKKLKEKFDNFKHEVQKDEYKEIVEYLQTIIDSKGLIYEENRITQLICKFIDSLKNNEKKVILVIDDLDRIDPEHIFRLFNVFACHFDTNKSNENKFNFDKIIFVCDIENIRNIYHSKYGMDVDFTGYIDKFYSREIFNFDNTIMIKKNIPKILESIFFNEQSKNIFNNHNLHNDLELILINLILSNSINLRTLLKFAYKSFAFDNYRINIFMHHNLLYNYHFNIILIYDFLFSLFGSHKSLINALNKCEKTDLIFKTIDLQWPIGNLLAILDFENNKLISKTENIYNFPEFDISIKYELIRNGILNNYISGIANRITKISNKEEEVIFFPYFTLLKKTFEKIYSLTLDKRS